MSNPIIRIHDTATNEIIDRPMTDEEFFAYQAELKLAAEQEAREKQEKIAKEAARADVLAKLGLTAEEVKVLLG